MKLNFNYMINKDKLLGFLLIFTFHVKRNIERIIVLCSNFFFFIVLDIPYLVSQQMKGMSRAISLLISSFFFFLTL